MEGMCINNSVEAPSRRQFLSNLAVAPAVLVKETYASEL